MHIIFIYQLVNSKSTHLAGFAGTTNTMKARTAIYKTSKPIRKKDFI
jgi:hypothetical protein